MATPYYEGHGVQLYLGDCREVLPTLPRESVDLIVTDPPYGKNWQSGRRKNTLGPIAHDDGTLDVAACITTACKVLRDKRHLYVFGPADLSPCPFGATAELIWDKEILGAGDLTIPWGPQHEPITFAVHISRPSNRAAGYGRLAARLRKGSVLRVPRANSGALEDRHNPHQSGKPVHLLRQLIESSSCLGETVLDPFAGHGPTLIAAALEGRNAIGVELDEACAEQAAKRLEGLV
ncbi:DNA-methyltransferase [Actinomadura montaniterrae]|uniref:Methyltransferase n=1 Tax=Actinomadura montaniterrae TaxID=1803903 RepID=A0A6L3W5V9_9ACTN|nr:DNA methyltransferase [Actinomadura montaniterrae]KAB2384725.1 site-specific DNA-methyltransferase [Actinomadura montaniterrae]